MKAKYVFYNHDALMSTCAMLADNLISFVFENCCGESVLSFDINSLNSEVGMWLNELIVSGKASATMRLGVSK